MRFIVSDSTFRFLTKNRHCKDARERKVYSTGLRIKAPYKLRRDLILELVPPWSSKSFLFNLILNKLESG